jgi:streptogramin lyase
MIRRKRAAALVLLVLVLAATITGRPVALVQAALPPHVNEATVATLIAHDITLSGDHLDGTARSIRFDYEGVSTTVDASSPLVHQWTATAISLTLPPVVHSGQLTVTVDGQASLPVALLVYMYSASTTGPGNATNHPLALALGADGTVWINDEFHTRLRSLSPAVPPLPAVYSIPQGGNPGIFAQNVYGDSRSSTTALGEDIAVASDGSVWFTEGGAYLYAGYYFNSSRIVRFDPATQGYRCYNVPTDEAEVAGLLLDEARGMVWYAESSLFFGNAIGSFSMADAQSDCAWDPTRDGSPPFCSNEPVAACHQRYELVNPYSSPVHLALDSGGNVWFTEFWATRVGRLDPSTGTIVEVPLPAPIVKQGPGIYAGAGPWTIERDAEGDLWVAETFDAKVLRVRPSLMASNDCTKLDAAGNNPCVTEVYAASNGTDGVHIHSVAVGADGRVWFGVSGPQDIAGATSRVGFIDTLHDDAVVLLPPLPAYAYIAGIREDPASRDVWFAQYFDRRLGRLQLASGDADGVADAVDGCPTVYDPGQENEDRNLISLAKYGKTFNDVTWPNSDNLGNACDADIDNDGLPNTAELALAPGGASHALCPSATANTDPMKLDSDGDQYADRGECLVGTDPVNAASKPPGRYATGDAEHDGLLDSVEALLGTNPNLADSDGDGVGDGIEVLRFTTDPLAKDTDADSCSDGKEIASINADRAVTSLDLLIVAQIFGSTPASAKYVPNFDIDRNGSIGATDLAIAAAQFGVCK